MKGWKMTSRVSHLIFLSVWPFYQPLCGQLDTTQIPRSQEVNPPGSKTFSLENVYSKRDTLLAVSILISQSPHMSCYLQSRPCISFFWHYSINFTLFTSMCCQAVLQLWWIQSESLLGKLEWRKMVGSLFGAEIRAHISPQCIDHRGRCSQCQLWEFIHETC